MSNTAPSFGKRITAPVLRLHYWLVGENNWMGWTPYLWLPYSGFLFIEWLYRPVDLLEAAATIAGLVVFLVLYFAGYRAVLKPIRIRIIAGLVILGLIFMPVNGGGSMYFIYATAFSGFIGSMRRGFLVLAGILGAALLEAALFGLPFWTWFPFLFFGVIIGLSNIYFGEMSRKNRALKQSQEEIRRLAATAERERIARDLHDILGHTLTLITVKAELAARLAERDLTAAAREIRELERISRDALKQVREAVGGYRAVGFAGELANARIALQSAGVELTAEPLQIACPPAHENLLAMVLRESVTNVVRHSGARNCRVQVTSDGNGVRLCVEDDGHGGFNGDGNGIRGMRERLAELEGSLDIVCDQHGTRVRAYVPLLSESEPAAISGRIAALR